MQIERSITFSVTLGVILSEGGSSSLLDFGYNFYTLFYKRSSINVYLQLENKKILIVSKFWKLNNFLSNIPTKKM